ncbi:MAG: late competence development ComFB family protein [Peptococcaceae bacterium]|nr:late competence development ComFB family protein [Peptococcaceae bacterium]
MLKNYTEVIVAEMLEEVLDELKKRMPDLCTCERCREDIMALALNRLSPRYVVRDEGEIYTKVNMDQLGGKAEVVTAILHGCEVVKNQPRHN